MDTEATTPENTEETQTVTVDETKPFILVQFHGDGSADADFRLSGGISELMLFGVSEMLKQFAYDHMAQKTMEKQLRKATEERGKPQILVPRDHLGAGGKRRDN